MWLSFVLIMLLITQMMSVEDFQEIVDMVKSSHRV